LKKLAKSVWVADPFPATTAGGKAKYTPAMMIIDTALLFAVVNFVTVAAKKGARYAGVREKRG
jgi:hypothetical protein